MTASGAGLLRALIRRCCPICGNADDTVEIYPERVDPARIDASSYASRKNPEYMNLRMVTCPCCDLLYAPSAPSASFLSRAYSDTGYGSAAEAGFAAASYAAALGQRIGDLPDRASALEIGAGNGALLMHLRGLGFSHVIGIEPSKEAVNSAEPDVRKMIQVESFDSAKLPKAYFTLVIANQTLEHIDDPLGLLIAAQALLKPGGALMIVSHDYRHWLMRLLGSRSPIIDIEHLQVFSRKSINFALRRAGFINVKISAFTNNYPLHYWARMLPMPKLIKQPMYSWLKTGSLRESVFRASVGNMFAWARTAGSLASSTNR